MSVAFLLTTLVVVATPGTGALYTVATGLAHGAKASVVAAAGCTLGIVPAHARGRHRAGGDPAQQRDGVPDAQVLGCGLPAVPGLD